MDLGPLQDVMYLLVMFPSIPSFKLNPWEVASIFYTYQKMNRSNGIEMLTQERDLPALFQIFSSTFHVKAASLAQYFASFYRTDGNGKSIMEEEIRRALLSPVLQYLLSYKNIKLLTSNQDIIKFEFLRIWTRQNDNQNDNDNTKSQLASTLPSTFISFNIIKPLPSYIDFTRCTDDVNNNMLFTLRENTCITWACEIVGITVDQANLLMRETQIFAAFSNRKQITFSVFVMFALRCFYEKLKDDLISEQTVVRSFLQSLSKNLTQIQQTMKIKVLKYLLQPNDIENNLIEKTDQSALFLTCISIFDKLPQRQIYAPEKFKCLPPIPPSIVWDAPRMVDFMKYFGVVQRSGSLSTTWIAYGNYLKLSSEKDLGWGNHVVPPSPIKIEVEALYKVLFFICEMCYEEEDIWLNNDSSGSKANIEASIRDIFDSYLRECILPIAVSNVEKYINVVEKTISEEFQVPMESLLRYGGARSMKSLFIAGIWLETVYEMLSHPIHQLKLQNATAEISVNIAVRIFSCLELISISDVMKEMYNSLHNRIRDNCNMTDGTLSYPEFEELLLRCAFHAWVAHDEGKRIYGKSHCPSEAYYMKCLADNVVDDHQQKSWGKDFVTPYALTLQYVIKNGADTKQSFEHLPEFLGLSKEKLYSVATSVQKQGNLESDLDNDDDEVDYESDEIGLEVIHEEDETSQFSADSPIKEMGELVSSAVVKSKADALIQGILNSRESNANASSPTDNNTSHIKGENRSSKSNSNTLLVDEDTIHFSKKASLPKSPTRTLLSGTKEALWPVYGTYCSCGDSVDPGKLSGPNLLALLSKLGVLTDQTVLSDIGILLHQISAHTNSSSVSIAAATSSETFESPSLSFEEFLVFLCAFAQLRFDGSVSAPILSGERNGQDKLSNANSQNKEVWFQNWKTFMGGSTAFRRLMEESVLPMLRRHPLLAHPQDARHRDKYSPVFSLEVLLAIEGNEDDLIHAFKIGKSEDGVFSSDSAVNILKSIGLVPAVVSAQEVAHLIKDVAPEGRASRSNTPTPMINSPNGNSSPSSQSTQSDMFRSDTMNFPQWEWIVCVVAFHGVEHALEGSENAQMSKIPGLVSGYIKRIAAGVSRL
jgi:hypothetical protein